MDLVLAFFSFLSQAPVVVGSINLLTLFSFGREGTHFIAKKLRREQPPDELFWSLFLSSSFCTLRDVISRHEHLAHITRKIRNKKLERRIDLSPSDLSVLFKCVPRHEDKMIQSYFSFLFKQIVHGVAELEVLPREELNSILQQAQEEVWTNWQSCLRDAYLRCPSLGGYTHQKQQERLALLASGEAIPPPGSGADERFIQASAPRCLKQELLTPDGRSLLSARPDATPTDWWKSLSDLLDNGPVFLTGPGGMGKTSFLSSLYRAIAQGEPEAEFSCAFLLSLDALMREPAPEIHLGISPLADASQSVLLRKIAQLSDMPGQERGWKKVLLQKFPVFFEQPVLLMLDGLNEMSGQATQDKAYLRHQILSEIRCLSDRERYPNVRIVVTSRIDRENLLESQLSSLPGFRHVVLGGVELPSELHGFLSARKIPLSPTMVELLKRPMYCQAVKDMLHQGSLPSTQFQLLDQMYRRLCRQGQDNMSDKVRLPCLGYLTEYFVPILAYAHWREGKLDEDLIQRQYDCFLQWSPMILCGTRQNKFEFMDQLHPVTHHLNLIVRYLCETMQLLFWEDGSFSFCHQDYRDFLVARYFLQRMEFMRRKPDCPLWQDTNVVNTLRLNTYSTGIMHLIYQAVSFSLPPSQGEDAPFVQKFYWDVDWKKTGFLPGHALWYTTAYQLVDLRGLEDVAYGGADLSGDALRIFAPLLSRVQQEEASLTETIHLSGRLLQNLIEVLMKCCELFRSRKDYRQARAITRAARHILSYNPDRLSMGNVVDYNESKVIFTQFLENGTDDELGTALEQLAHSVAHGAPFRYACNTLAMLLVSPHPKIRSHPAFLAFRQEFLRGQAPGVCAFRLYHAALFDPRKEGEDWQPRIYSLRQMLYLLSDHRVRVTGLTAARLEFFSPQDLQNLDLDCIHAPLWDSPFPPMENILLIRRFLAEIRDIETENTRWKHYMQGLSALYDRPPHIADAKRELAKAGKRDVRARLLLAFLDRDPEKLHLYYQRLRPERRVLPKDIGGYCVREYYTRDIARFCHALRTEALRRKYGRRQSDKLWPGYMAEENSP